MSDSQAATEPALKRARVEEAAAAAPVVAPAAAPVAIAAPAAAAAAPIANGASSQQSAGTAAAAAAAAAPTPVATADAVSTVRMPGVTVCCLLCLAAWLSLWAPQETT
jgi:pilus assembly protein FimV